MENFLPYTQRNAQDAIVQAWARTPAYHDGIPRTPAQITWNARLNFFQAFGFLVPFIQENPCPLFNDKSPFDISIPTLRSVRYLPEDDAPTSTHQTTAILPQAETRTSFGKTPSFAPSVSVTPSETRKRKDRASSTKTPIALLPDRNAEEPSHRDKKIKTEHAATEQSQLRYQWPRRCHRTPKPSDEITTLEYPNKHTLDLKRDAEIGFLKLEDVIIWINDPDETTTGDNGKIWIAGEERVLDRVVPRLQSLVEQIKSGGRWERSRYHSC